jgi:hypothetical protein
VVEEDMDETDPRDKELIINALCAVEVLLGTLLAYWGPDVAPQILRLKLYEHLVFSFF